MIIFVINIIKGAYATPIEVRCKLDVSQNNPKAYNQTLTKNKLDICEIDMQS